MPVELVNTQELSFLPLLSCFHRSIVTCFLCKQITRLIERSSVFVPKNNEPLSPPSKNKLNNIRFYLIDVQTQKNSNFLFKVLSSKIFSKLSDLAWHMFGLNFFLQIICSNFSSKFKLLSGYYMLPSKRDCLSNSWYISALIYVHQLSKRRRIYDNKAALFKVTLPLFIFTLIENVVSDSELLLLSFQ